jgi:hypothetical protein
MVSGLLMLDNNCEDDESTWQKWIVEFQQESTSLFKVDGSE